MFKSSFFSFLVTISCLCASTRDIPEPVRKVYAEKFHEAFVTQCIGTPLGAIGITMTSSGFFLMFNSLNNAYADYERSQLDLKMIESQMKNACAKDQ